MKIHAFGWQYEGGAMFFKRKPKCKQPAGYNPPPDDVKRPERPTPAPPAKLYDKLGRLI